MNALAVRADAVALHAADGSTVHLRFADARRRCDCAYLVGSTPSHAVERVTTTRVLCRHAQRRAAMLALSAAGAGGDVAAVEDRAARTREWLREHAVSLFLAWPALSGDSPEVALPRALLASDADATLEHGPIRALLEETVLGMPASVFLALDREGLRDWMGAAGTATARRFRRASALRDARVPVRGLPQLDAWTASDARELARMMATAPLFSLSPRWRGRCAEVGAVSRQKERPLVGAWLADHGAGSGVRLLARLVELALAVSSRPLPLSERVWRLPGDSALAAVETARGPLLHWTRLRDGRVHDYRVVAPTEWNFQPGGVLARALATLPRQGAFLPAARRWMHALDPCEDCTLEVGDA